MERCFRSLVEEDVIQADFGNGALQLILSKLNRSKEKP